MRVDQRRIVYTAVAINTALAIWLTLTVALQTIARSSMPDFPNRTAFLVERWLDALLVLTLLASAWSELKKWRVAVWVNLAWPLVSAICSPLLFLAEAKGDSHRQLVTQAAKSSIYPFVFLLILYAVLYRLSFRKHGSEPSEAAGSQTSSKVYFYTSLFLFLYPIFTYLLFVTDAIRVRHNDSFFVLGNFLSCPLSIVSLVLSLRSNGSLKKAAVALSLLALVANGLLFILIGFAY